jgi:hypothetical protein
MRPMQPAETSPATPPARPPLRGAGIGLLLAILGLLSGGLLVGRLATLPPLHFAPDDPGIEADGFYPSETSTEGVRFRWSRPSAGFVLPALAARQVYTLELAAPRPGDVPAPTGIRLAANGVDLPIAPSGAWTVVTLTAPSQIGLGNALALVGAASRAATGLALAQTRLGGHAGGRLCHAGRNRHLAARHAAGHGAARLPLRQLRLPL